MATINKNAPPFVPLNQRPGGAQALAMAGAANPSPPPVVMGTNGLPCLSKSPMIHDVWADNLEEEFAILRSLVKDYPYVAMDTEFPGVVAKPVGNFKTTHEFYYQTLRCNINMLKLIQVGITLLNEKGEVPEHCSTWQFNFRFNLGDDIYAQDSITILENGGINFNCFAEYGIEQIRFAELLTSSGLLLNPDVRWLTFQAGYDFGYLIKVVCNKELPEREEDFQQLFHALFPTMFDLKYLLRSTERSFMGLDALAESLKLRRFGTAHQAGSDSLLTGHCYFRLVPDSFHGQTPNQLNGVIYALSEDSASSATPSSASSLQLNNHHSAATVSHNSYQNTGAFPSAPMQGGNGRAK